MLRVPQEVRLTDRVMLALPTPVAVAVDDRLPVSLLDIDGVNDAVRVRDTETVALSVWDAERVVNADADDEAVWVWDAVRETEAVCVSVRKDRERRGCATRPNETAYIKSVE